MLLKESAAVDFAANAFVHLKAIGASDAAKPLLDKANVEKDDGVTGLGKDHLPTLSIGYVYLPALVGIVIGTFITVPRGARMAHTIPVTRLKKIFAVILFILATRMLWSLF